MVYASTFHRLVIGGTIYAEKWNTSLSIDGDLPAVSSSLLTNIAGVVSSWWSSTGSNAPQFLNVNYLTFIKLNRIGVDGKYADEDSMTHDYPTPIIGPSSGSNAVPQLACVATLRTAAERGRANRGRMFLPPVTGFDQPSSDGRASAANALRVANGVSTLINSLRTAYVTQYGPGGQGAGVSVVSNIGAGTSRYVTYVEVGRVIDTTRSRRSSLPEDRQTSAVTITPPTGP
jgi:hypothetical protein